MSILVLERNNYNNSLEHVSIELGGSVFIIYDYPTLLTTEDLNQEFYVEIIGTDDAWKERYGANAKNGMTALHSKLKSVRNIYEIAEVYRAEKLINKTTFCSVAIWFKSKVMDRSLVYTKFQDFIKAELER